MMMNMKELQFISYRKRDKENEKDDKRKDYKPIHLV